MVLPVAGYAKDRFDGYLRCYHHLLFRLNITNALYETALWTHMALIWDSGRSGG